MSRSIGQKIGWLVAVVIVVIAGWWALTRRPEPVGAPGTLTIVTSNFAAYDFLRAILADTDTITLTYLLKPGQDAHRFDPTPADLIAIKQADLFVYVGGEMEAWAEVLAAGPEAPPSLRLSELVDTLDETTPDDAEPDDDDDAGEAFDEHIWTAPSNAQALVTGLAVAVAALDPAHADQYIANAESYNAQIQEVADQIQAIVAARERDRLVFADRMPLQYFLEEYGLRASAAFPGCSQETEPSARTIAALEERVRREGIPVIFYLELGDGHVARAIAADLPGLQVRQFQSLHNVSGEDFAAGATWVSLMTRNLAVLREALQ